MAYPLIRSLNLVLLAEALAFAQTYSLPNNNAGCPSTCRQITWSAGSDQWNAGTLPTYPGYTCSPLYENGSTDDSSRLQACINAAAARTGAYAGCPTTGCAVLIPAGTVYINGTVRLANKVVVRGAKPQGAVYGSTWLPAADASATTIKLGASANLTSQNFSWATNVYPPTSYNTFPSSYCYLTGTPQKGDTTVTTSASNGSSCATPAGAWITIYGNDTPSLIALLGTQSGWPPGSHCDWCGLNQGFYGLQQIVKVTAATNSGAAGATLTLSKALYYPPDTASRQVPGAGGTGSSTEPAGAKYSVVTYGTQYAGYENLRIDGSSADVGGTPEIDLQGCLFCWVKNVETYMTGSSTDGAHVRLSWGSYGNEVRDSYLHDQRSGASGSGYGVYIDWFGGDHKIENNIIRHNRHWIVFQGGGTGVAVLYNYADDGYSDDISYMGSGRTAHGAHQIFNLFEGNVVSHLAADDFWGTSSHNVMWRNWIWGDETMKFEDVQSPGQCAAVVSWQANHAFTSCSTFQAFGVSVRPATHNAGNYYYALADGASCTSGSGPATWNQTIGGTQSDGTCTWTNTGVRPQYPNSGFDAVDLYGGQTYYAYVGNVLGVPSIPTGADNTCSVTSTIPRHAVWSSATVSATCSSPTGCGYDSPTSPVVYSYGNSALYTYVSGTLGGNVVTSSGTIIRNANYDYKTNGVAYWDGGSTNNTIASSLYYASKPAFLGSCRWPLAGPDQSPVYSMNAAEATYLGANIGSSSSAGGQSTQGQVSFQGKVTR